MSSRKWMFVSILVLMCMVFSACTPAATPTAAPAAPAATTAPAAPAATTAPAAGSGPLLVVINKSADQQYFIDLQNSFSDTATGLGATVKKFNAKLDPNLGVSLVNDAISAGAKGISITVPDQTIGPAISDAAKKAGVVLIATDDGIKDSSGNPVPFVGFDGKDMGKKVGQEAATLLSTAGWLKDTTKKVGVLSVEVQTLSVCNDRTDNEKAAIEAAGVPAAQVFSVPYTGETLSAQDAAGPIITAHPDVTNWIVFGCNDEGVLGTLNALATAGVTPDNIIGVGLGAYEACKPWAAGQPSGFKAALFISGLDVGKTAATVLYDAVTKGTPPPADSYAPTTIVDPNNYKTVFDPISLGNCSNAPAAPAATTAAPAATTAPAANSTPFTFGMVLVGPYNDSGWSEATYDGGQYVVSKIPNTKMVYVDNGFSHQGVTPAQLAEQLVSQGAKLIIFNSDDFKDDSNTFAKAHPDIPTIMLSGDQAWKDGQAYMTLPNMVNIMGRMEYMKEIAGCAAALTTQTGQIGYLGPLINDETRRLSSSAFLGAKYCWTNYVKKDPAQLKFKVTWIGYWFNEPGITLDPTKVADDFFSSNYDVVMSGIDTTEALTEAKKQHDAGKNVWAVSYDYKNNCSTAPDVCLGVPYFNWGPGIETAVQAAIGGKFTEGWSWNGPDWTNINNPDTSAVGFNKGQGLSAANSASLDKFIAELAGGLNLWKGPLNLQDKSVYLTDGTAATDQQIWYLPQLLQGMDGQSVSK